MDKFKSPVLQGLPDLPGAGVRVDNGRELVKGFNVFNISASPSYPYDYLMMFDNGQVLLTGSTGNEEEVKSLCIRSSLHGCPVIDFGTAETQECLVKLLESDISPVISIPRKSQINLSRVSDATALRVSEPDGSRSIYCKPFAELPDEAKRSLLGQFRVAVALICLIPEEELPANCSRAVEANIEACAKLFEE